MVNCGACGRFLSPVGAASCSACPAKYHRACVAITDKALISKDWVCPDCKKNLRKGDNNNTPVKGIDETAVTEAVMPLPLPSNRENPVGLRRADGGELATKAGTEVNEGVTSIQAFMREFRDCMEVMRNFKKEIVEEMREFRREMAQWRDSISVLTERMDVVEQRLEAAERSGGDIRVQELERTVDNLKRELNDRDQEALLSDLEIGHLPEEKGENAYHAVAVFATRLGVKLEERDVVFANRVGAPPAEAGGRPRRVVVRLARRHLRDELLRAARVRRAGLLSAGDGQRVYINERLTRPNRQLFHRVREECRNLRWRYSWTRNGRIFARQGEGAPVHQFRANDDLKVFSRQTSANKSPANKEIC